MRTAFYRLNYGNGQVHHAETLDEAILAYQNQAAFDRLTGQSSGRLRIEKYVGDDAPDGWITLKLTEEQASKAVYRARHRRR